MTKPILNCVHKLGMGAKRGAAHIFGGARFYFPAKKKMEDGKIRFST